MLRLTVAIAICFISLPSAVLAQGPRNVVPTPTMIGRYQLVPEPQGTIFLLDTVTGRVWRHTLLTQEGKETSVCAGLKICFYEVDRIEITSQGYKSELMKR
jgi:hypothetical protein